MREVENEEVGKAQGTTVEIIGKDPFPPQTLVGKLLGQVQREEARPARDTAEEIISEGGGGKVPPSPLDELFASIDRGDMDKALAISEKINGKDGARDTSSPVQAGSQDAQPLVSKLFNHIGEGDMGKADATTAKILGKEPGHHAGRPSVSAQQGNLQASEVAASGVVSDEAGAEAITKMIHAIEDGNMDEAKHIAEDQQQHPVAELFDSVEHGDASKSRVLAKEIVESAPEARNASVGRLFDAVSQGNMSAASKTTHAIMEDEPSFVALFTAIENGELDRAQVLLDRVSEASASYHNSDPHDSASLDKSAFAQAMAALEAGKSSTPFEKGTSDAGLGAEAAGRKSGAEADEDEVVAPASWMQSDKVFAQLGEAMDKKDLRTATRLAEEARIQMQERAQQVLGKLTAVAPEMKQAELVASEGLKACTPGKGEPEEMLAHLKQCTESLERFAKVTESIRSLSLTSNVEYRESLDKVSSLLSRLQDSPTMAAALEQDQQKVRRYLLREADTVAASIDSMQPLDSVQPG